MSNVTLSADTFIKQLYNIYISENTEKYKLLPAIPILLAGVFFITLGVLFVKSSLSLVIVLSMLTFISPESLKTCTKSMLEFLEIDFLNNISEKLETGIFIGDFNCLLITLLLGILISFLVLIVFSGKFIVGFISLTHLLYLVIVKKVVFPEMINKAGLTEETLVYLYITLLVVLLVLMKVFSGFYFCLYFATIGSFIVVALLQFANCSSNNNSIMKLFDKRIVIDKTNDNRCLTMVLGIIVLGMLVQSIFLLRRNRREAASKAESK